MYKISELENGSNDFLNNDNLYGIINVFDDNLSEMARFGKIPETQLEIHIESGEGYIPHMHICKKSGNNIVLRIKLLTNEYFREKDDRNNTLSSSERKALNDYLNKKVQYSKMTNWQFLVLMWNQYNPAHTKDPNIIPQPNYTTILEP